MVWHVLSSCYNNSDTNILDIRQNIRIADDVVINDCTHDNCDHLLEKPGKWLKESILIGGVFLSILLLIIFMALFVLFWRARSANREKKSQVPRVVEDPTYELVNDPKYYSVENYVNEQLYKSNGGCINRAYSQMSTSSELSQGPSLEVNLFFFKYF